MIEIIKTLIADFHSNGPPSGAINRELSVPLDAPKIISILGPRRSGKTWYLYTLINHLRKTTDIHDIVYINFEDERLHLDAENLGIVIDAYQQLYPDKPLNKVYFFFDEIQEVPGWEKFVRRVSETISTNVFVTGSSAKLMSREIASSLRGRTLAYRLLPYTFREYLRAFDKNPDGVPNATGERNRIIALFDHFIEHGGYPEVTRFDEQTRLKTLQSYFEIMLYRDIIERFTIGRPHLVKDFARRLMASNAQIFSIHKYYRDLKSRNIRVTKDTLYAFVDHFADAQFAIPANRYDPSEAKQSQALKKYYMNDTGLVNACEFMPPQKRGSLLETLVFLELQKRDMIVNYFSGPNECDFVVQEKGRITEAIQVCYDLTPENRNRESAGVIAAMERFGLKEGLIITQSQENIIESKAGKIHILPAWKWCLDL